MNKDGFPFYYIYLQEESYFCFSNHRKLPKSQYLFIYCRFPLSTQNVNKNEQRKKQKCLVILGVVLRSSFILFLFFNNIYFK
ncbi:hypothetical protein SPOG_05718 [Schizosaccharomyces cryophilus OY26]|uniref:Transmembrane protein n=1 Tax=Schizosaccharomyces cryophilus (strain OY26 / ATCC MYA-4695 / CBS 11777 / NBRC 106824 / NRRL Y48691) TaxID=653667 RepID=S9W151_SCHCR|nr:uncharacterized protein SPOG_05718 [Schizosaccharomyces cryophilus OY26]EPY53658.1 hypothetical protein SPOG_05718 [Schizosaccharomyces cryophilus OY26]